MALTLGHTRLVPRWSSRWRAAPLPKLPGTWTTVCTCPLGDAAPMRCQASAPMHVACAMRCVWVGRSVVTVSMLLYSLYFSADVKPFTRSVSGSESETHTHELTVAAWYTILTNTHTFTHSLTSHHQLAQFLIWFLRDVTRLLRRGHCRDRQHSTL